VWLRDAMDISPIGRILIIIGLAVAAIGLLLTLGGKLPWFGRLPGDIQYKGENFTFYFPLATSVIVSLVLSLVLWLINRK
jgi:membrane protein implicated in regulation of membrane protease activity